MNIESKLQKAVDKYHCGDIDGAIAIVTKILEKRPTDEWVAEYAKAYLYLAVFNRWNGNFETGIRIIEKILESDQCDSLTHAQALIERAYMLMASQKYEEALGSLDRAEIMIDENGLASSDRGQESLILMHYFHCTRGVVQSRSGCPAGALQDFHRAMDVVMKRQSYQDCSREQITLCLNLYSVHMVMGNVDTAAEYLTLAHAKMKMLDIPHAFGLIHFFENLAAHNLFAAGSQNKAIEALSHISEEVVNSFADSRRVFDFFSSIIVQLHDGKVDLGKIRESIRGYGDDELIKAYLPVLLANAPPPGSDDGDDDIPAATLTD